MERKNSQQLLLYQIEQQSFNAGVKIAKQLTGSKKGNQRIKLDSVLFAASSLLLQLLICSETAHCFMERNVPVPGGATGMRYRRRLV